MTSGAVAPTVSDFALVFSTNRAITIPFAASQSPACGYTFYLYYSVNEVTSSTSPGNLAVDLTNQSQAVLVLS